MLTIVAMADTHTFHDELDVPDGDVLIHAGDMGRIGSLPELEWARDFLATLPHPYKIVVAGNHDRAFEDQPEQARNLFKDFIYLGLTQNQSIFCLGKGLKPLVCPLNCVSPVSSGSGLHYRGCQVLWKPLDSHLPQLGI
jgi:hypothetical protein